jgi:hypothetical protein
MVPCCSGRAMWPSTPDLFEMMELSRRGYEISGLDRRKITVKHCLSPGLVKDDIRLATRIVKSNIVGVRTEIEVPNKYIRHFRRYQGFLILTTRYAIPSGVVRFLLAQWIKLPTSLWLVENCPFKIFLKRHAYRDFVSVAVVVKPVKDRKNHVWVGSPITPSSSSKLDFGGVTYRLCRVFPGTIGNLALQ